MNRQFWEGEIHIAYTHFKGLHIITDKKNDKLQLPIRFLLTLVRMLIINNTNIKCCNDDEKIEFLYILIPF